MKYVLLCETRYDSFDAALAQAPGEIRAHLERTKEFHARGTCLMAGAFRESGEALSTMGVFTTREAAEEFVRGDPFVLNSMVCNWSIRAWSEFLAGP